MRIPIGTGTSKGRSIPLTAERLVNMYAERAPSGAKSQVVVHGCPGLTRFCDIDTRRTRGLYRTSSDGRLYVVIRNTLYYVSPEGVATDLGTIAGSGRVGMSDNGTQLCIVAGATGYTYTVAGGLQVITDPDFPGANTVTFLDGFFIFNNASAGQRGQFFISNLLDGQMYDALDFATAEAYPDNLIRVFADHSQLLLFGAETIEVWFNAGLADFPFTRAQGSVIEQGLGARWTVAKLDETVVWLDNEGMVRSLQGNTPVRISTHAIEYEITRGDWNNATAWSYVEEGHQFYVLTVPAANLATQKAGTYVYDAATQLWHERKSYRKDYSRSGFYAYAYGKHITADIDIGRLYSQSLDVYEEDGEHLIAEMQFPQVQNDGKRFIVDRLQLDMEVGGETIKSFGDQNLYRPYVAYIDQNNNSLQAYAIDHQAGTLNKIGDPYLIPSITQSSMASFSENRIAMARIGNVSQSLDQYNFLGNGWDESGNKLFFNDDYASIDLISGVTFVLARGDDSTIRSWRRVNDNIWQSVSSELYVPGMSSPSVCHIGNEIIAISDGGLDQIRTYQYSSGSWSEIGVRFDYPNGLGFSNICHIGGNRIAITDTVNDHLATLQWDGSIWSFVGNPLSMPGLNYCSITYLGGNRICAADLSVGTIRMYDFNGTTWKQFGIGASPDEPIFFPSLASFGELTTSNGSSVNGYTSPEVMLDVSGNTRTFDMNQNWRSMGKQGEYDKRVIWRRLGQHRSFTPRIAISAPVKRAIFAAYADIRPCKS